MKHGISGDERQFPDLSGMTHVRTSVYFAQSNGKIERYHKSLKSECIRPKTPLSLEDAKRIVGDFFTHCNDRRLHSVIGYVAPRQMLEGRQGSIHAERGRKLEMASEHRAKVRAEQRVVSHDNNTRSEDSESLGSDPSAASIPSAASMSKASELGDGSDSLAASAAWTCF